MRCPALLTSSVSTNHTLTHPSPLAGAPRYPCFLFISLGHRRFPVNWYIQSISFIPPQSNQSTSVSIQASLLLFSAIFFLQINALFQNLPMAPKYPPSSLSYFPPLPSPSSRCRAGWAMLPHTRHDLYTQLTPSFFLCPGQKNIRSLCFDHPIPGTNLYLYSSVTYLLLTFLFLSVTTNRVLPLIPHIIALIGFLRLRWYGNTPLTYHSSLPPFVFRLLFLSSPFSYHFFSHISILLFPFCFFFLVTTYRQYYFSHATNWLRYEI